MPALGRQVPLTGLRGVAVLGVVAEHASYLLVTPAYGRFLAPGGFLGVDVFFVLSGFLITSLLLDEQAATGRVAVGAFYLRRVLRLVPALVAVVLTVVAVELLVDRLRPGDVAVTALVSLLYVTNWVSTFRGTEIDPSLGHLWSLAVEEQYYLVWPLVVAAVLGAGWGRRRWTVLLTAGITASALAKAATWLVTGRWELVYFRTDGRVDALLVGALLAVWRSSGGDLGRLRVAFWPALALLLACTWLAAPQQGWYYLGGSTAVAVAVAVVVASVLTGSTARRPWLAALLERRVLVHVGTVSYGVYLWHVPVFHYAGVYLHLPTGPRGAVAVALSFALAELSYRVVELPFLRRKRSPVRPDVVPAVAP